MLERQVTKHNEHGSRDVKRSVDEAGAVAAGALAEAEREMQEKRGLQRCGLDVGPVDGEIKSIQFACVLEGIEDEGHQAEDVKVGRLRRGPPSEEDIETDGEIDETDEALELKIGAIGGLENDADVDGDGLGPVGGLAEDGVGGVAPDAGAVHLIGRRRDHGSRRTVDGGEDVALADAGFIGSGAGGDDVSFEAALGFDPAGAIGGSGVVALLDQVGDGQTDRSQSHDCKEDGQQTGLGTASQRSTLGYLAVTYGTAFSCVVQLNCQTVCSR